MSDSFTNLLAIDTSTKYLRLALAFGEDRIIKVGEEADQAQGQMIMKKIADLFASAQRTPKDLHGIVVSTGPGSFTGLRIGIATAKGIVQALGIPIVGVSVFEAAAEMLRDEQNPVEIITAVRRDEFISATVKQGHFDSSSIRVIPITGLADQVQANAFAFVGLGEEMRSYGAGANLSHRILFDASHILQIGKTKLQNGQSGDVVTLEPLYIQKSQAEIRFEQRQSNQSN